MKIESFFAQVFPFDRSAYSFYSANFYDLYNSYALHCDNLGDGRGYYQAVIPLEVPPQPTYTIVFDQTASENVEWISPFYRKPAGYKPFHNKPIYDASWFGNWRDEYRISEEDGAKYWGPAWAETFREAYKGFSIKCAYRWSVGDVLIFNSRFAHCASDLRQLGIEKKTGLLICLERKSR